LFAIASCQFLHHNSSFSRVIYCTPILIKT
jgi:hypothetical protein